MKFCDNCGAFMQQTSRGYLCPKCGAETLASIIEVRREEKPIQETVYVVERSIDESALVNRTCPECGNTEAFRIGQSLQGEHAGVKQDRSVERFKCAECGQTWTEG